MYLLEDFGIPEAYRYFISLLAKETNQQIKDLVSSEVQNQQAFVEKVYDVTGGRVHYINQFMKEINPSTGFPTGSD